MYLKVNFSTIRVSHYIICNFLVCRPVCDAVVKVLDIRNEMICCQLLNLIKSILGSVDYKVTIYTHIHAIHSSQWPMTRCFVSAKNFTFCIANLMIASHNFVYVHLNGLCVCNIHEL